MDRVETIARWLGVFLSPSQWTELKGLSVMGKKALNAFFRGDELRKMAEQALEWEAAGATSVRFSFNPLRPDIAESRRFAKAEDYIGRTWLFVDCEHRAGHSDAPASDEERAASWQVVGRARGTLEAFGLVQPVVADSGNGWHLLYRIALPHDDVAKEMLRAVLKGLDERCSDETARVDPATYQITDALKVYGTLSRKGTPTESRPWRYSQLIEEGKA